MCNIVFTGLVKDKFCTMKQALVLSEILDGGCTGVVPVDEKAVAVKLGMTPKTVKDALERLYKLSFLDKMADGKFVLNEKQAFENLARMEPEWEHSLKDKVQNLRDFYSRSKAPVNAEPKRATEKEKSAYKLAPAAEAQPPEFQLTPVSEKPVAPRKSRVNPGIPSSVREVAEYLEVWLKEKIAEGETKYSTVDPKFAAEKFWDHYEPKGFLVGKVVMKDWHRCAQKVVRDNWGGNVIGSAYRNEYTEQEKRNMTETQKEDYRSTRIQIPVEEWIVKDKDGKVDNIASQMRRIALEEQERQRREKMRNGGVNGTVIDADCSIVE